MQVLLVQPPFSQLNAPYPAIYYLSQFLRSEGVETRAEDHSIKLYRRLFSRGGLAEVFAKAQDFLDQSREVPADAAVLSQLRRYLSYRELWLEWIDPLMDFLSGGDPALAHRLTRAAELPVGMRSQGYIDRNEGSLGTDQARALATAMLEDLGDLITFVLDPSFGTVRYGERLASSASFFPPIKAALENSPLLGTFYEAILSEAWSRGRPDYLLVSIPFPGCLLGALACARSCRQNFGDKVKIVFGGGYVNTELRDLRDPALFDFCDYLSFDSGFGSLAAILGLQPPEENAWIYKTMYRDPRGHIVADPGISSDSGGSAQQQESKFRGIEDEAIKTVQPDYREADFGSYLRVVDSENPMHRLWSDSPWLKYRLAQGCYWRRCEFCDTQLEYVSRFASVRLQPLLEAADSASERLGLYGLHFVDEAMPMASLLAFAEANRLRARQGKRAFHYWGNVRFDASWTADRCEFLAASGLVAVSGGIEIASEKGLKATDKGFDLAGLVKSLVAMKSAGLLVHAYLIYGFPGQSAADIQESADLCRNLFAAGLIDSGFWHRFVLTRHSRMYAEWRRGDKPGLAPLDRPWDFANNDLRFAGEDVYDRYDEILPRRLEAWMQGEDLPEQLPQKLQKLIEKASFGIEEARRKNEGRLAWIAGQPLIMAAERTGGHEESQLVWSYRGESQSLRLPPSSARALKETLVELSSTPLRCGGAQFLARTKIEESDFLELKKSGLVIL